MRRRRELDRGTYRAPEVDNEEILQQPWYAATSMLLHSYHPAHRCARCCTYHDDTRDICAPSPRSEGFRPGPHHVFRSMPSKETDRQISKRHRDPFYTPHRPASPPASTFFSPPDSASPALD